MEELNNEIKLHGLFSYSDFEQYVPYEVYCAFPAQYLTISIAHEKTTYEEMIDLFYRFLL